MFPQHLRHLGRCLTGIVAPHTCPVCGITLQHDESFICLHCLYRVPRTGMHRLDWNTIHERLTTDAPVHRAGAWYAYDSTSPYARLIRRFKYSGSTALGRAMTHTYVREILSDNPRWFDGIQAIIPTPISWVKRLQRGYNQTEHIARAIALETGIPPRTDLLLARYHRAQARSNRMQRLRQISDTIHAADHAKTLAGQHVLLVDDIITTGATMRQCVRALRRATNNNITISVLALGLTSDR